MLSVVLLPAILVLAAAQAASHPARGCAVPWGRDRSARAALPGRCRTVRPDWRGVALPGCCVLAVPGVAAMALAGHSGHLQSKQPQVNKHANNSVREGKRGASPEPPGRHLPGLEPAPWPRRGAGRCPAVWPVPASRAAKKGKPQPLAVPRRRCVRSPRCQGASEQTGQGASVVWDSATRRRPGRWLRWRWRLWSVAGPLRTRQPRGTLLAITCSGERGFGLCWCHQHGHSPDTARRDTAAGLAEQELTGGAGVAVSCAGSKVSR